MSQSSNEKGRCVRDVVFAQTDVCKLRLNLFFPEHAARPPLVMAIHGGAWRTKSYHDCPAPWLTDHGFAVASVGYRLSTQAVFPAQVHDVKAAVRFLRAKADEYGYDAGRVGVLGSSAGGHLAALLGVTAEHDALEGNVGSHAEQSSSVQAVVDLYGPADFITRSQRHPEKTEVPGSIVYELLGGSVQEKAQLAALASPVTHVSADSAPLLIFHGDQDQQVEIYQSQLLQEAYRNAGFDTQLHVVRGAGHGGPEFSTAENQKLIVDFLRQALDI